MEGTAAGVELVEHEAERVDVAADADLAALQLLRRHVAGRPRTHVLFAERFGEAGQAEVGDAHVALAVEHQVRGLEVPVEDTLLVRGGEPRAELPRDVERLVGRQPADAPQERREVLAVHQLHGQEEVALRLPHVVHPADRRVRDLPRHPDLAVEPREPLAVCVEPVRQELEGDRLLELQVVGPVDLAHPAAADEPGDAVAPRQDRAGHEPLARPGGGSPLEGVRSWPGEGVGERDAPGRGAVPVGLSAMSRPDPQAGHDRSDAPTGVAQLGHANMATLRALNEGYVDGGRKSAVRPAGSALTLGGTRARLRRGSGGGPSAPRPPSGRPAPPGR